jgi:hypothetical protein
LTVRRIAQLQLALHYAGVVGKELIQKFQFARPRIDGIDQLTE